MATTGAAAAGGAQDQALARAHRAMLDTPGLQFDFASVPQPRTPRWLEMLGEFLEGFAPLFRAVAPLLPYIFWGGLALGAALVGWFLLNELLPDALPWNRKRAAPAATDWRPAPEAARSLLEEADALAAAGRFEEAIHLLLFRSLEDLSARRPGLVRPALTSRDIARLQAIPEAPRGAFARIAEAVERTFFGGRPADADAFGSARRDYEAFAFAEGWR